MSKLDLIGPSYEEESLDINAQKCVNMYLNRSTQDEKAVSEMQLLPTPGLKQMIDLSANSVRGLIEHSNRLFAVADTAFVELTYNSTLDSMTSTSRGTLDDASGRLSIAINDTQIFIADTDNDESYIFTPGSNTFAKITDSDFQGAQTVTYLDSYFVYNLVGSKQVAHTATDNGSSIDALDIATAEAKPDLTVAVKAFNDELWIFGTDSIEVWYNAENPIGFTFSPKGNIVFDIGCASPYVVSSNLNTLFWLDPNGVVYATKGYEPQIISTAAITRAFEDYTKTDAFSYTYIEEGHLFYVITFPTDSKTWVFDASTSAWHERAYKNSAGELKRHHSNCYALHQKKHFVGAHDSGIIYRQGRDLFTDAGDAIKRIRVSRHGNFQNKNVTMYYVDLLAETGAADSADDPQIILEVSRDGGRTYGNELWRSLGSTGEYQKRIRWNRLGTARNFTLKLTLSHDANFALIDANTQIAIAERDR